MSNDVATLQSVQDKVRERITQSFADLIPRELWDKMVSAELDRITKHLLPGIVQEAAKAQLTETIKAQLSTPEWQQRWGGNGGELASEALEKILRQVAPDLVAALFGNFAQRIVEAMRNGTIRPYGY